MVTRVKNFSHQISGLLTSTFLMVGATIAPVQAQSVDCNAAITVFGTRDKMIARDLSASVLLKDVALTPNSVGYGPGVGRASEVTIANGKIRLAHPDDGGSIVLESQIADQGAAFLVTASPKKWANEIAIDVAFDALDLSDLIGEAATAQGCSGEQTFPFKITGHANELEWSVEGSPKKVVGVSEDVDVVIVGVYSNHDKHRTFTVPGLEIHAHVYVPSENLAGHLVQIILDENAKLFLPATSN